MINTSLSPRARYAILLASFAGLLFDGVELGLMPIASRSVTKSLLGAAYSETLSGEWFARFTAALMLGAALGGIVLGNLGDRLGRARAMGISILFYSLFAGLGAWVQSLEQMLVLRFLVGLGVGGMWPNAIALVSECWSQASRPWVSGVMSAGLNAGILLLSQLARLWPITPTSWHWAFQLSGLPALLGVLVLLALPESPAWLASRLKTKVPTPPLRELFRPALLRTTLAAMAISSIPLIGAWSASKWMIPWSEQRAGTLLSYKAATQGWWALGATLGSFLGAHLVTWLGSRRSYLLISLGAASLTIAMFQATEPLTPSFHPLVFTQGVVATLFFGWLAVFLPGLFPVQVRATGSGLAFNVGRFATAAGALLSGLLFTQLGGDYPRVGTYCALIYALGVFAIWLTPRGRDQRDLELNPDNSARSGSSDTPTSRTR